MERYDKKSRYCPMLGHEIPFKYCRSTSDNQPCRKIRDCWFELIPIQQYIEQCLTDDQKQYLGSPRPAKTIQLYELIKKSQRIQSE